MGFNSFFEALLLFFGSAPSVVFSDFLFFAFSGFSSTTVSGVSGSFFLRLLGGAFTSCSFSGFLVDLFGAGGFFSGFSGPTQNHPKPSSKCHSSPFSFASSTPLPRPPPRPLPRPFPRPLPRPGSGLFWIWVLRVTAGSEGSWQGKVFERSAERFDHRKLNSDLLIPGKKNDLLIPILIPILFYLPVQFQFRHFTNLKSLASSSLSEKG